MLGLHSNGATTDTMPFSVICWAEVAGLFQMVAPV